MKGYEYYISAAISRNGMFAGYVSSTVVSKSPITDPQGLTEIKNYFLNEFKAESIIILNHIQMEK